MFQLNHAENVAKLQVYSDLIHSLICFVRSSSGMQCDTIPKDMDGNLLAQNASNTKDGTIIPGLSPEDKVCQKPLLLKTVKTVASGTAIFGLLFLLLHLRCVQCF